MAFKSIALAATTLVLSTGVNAAILSYGGYTHDTTTDIVTGKGLEWLQWDRTLGHSINSIQSQLDTLEGGGWSIASNTQMDQLINAFDFGYTFVSTENTNIQVGTGYSSGDAGNEADELFITMFGDSYTSVGLLCGSTSDRCTTARALYGSDDDGDGRYKHARVIDDYILANGTEIGGNIQLSNDAFLATEVLTLSGVALVRDVSLVPVPAGVWLFGSGLVGLIGVARRKKA